MFCLLKGKGGFTSFTDFLLLLITLFFLISSKYFDVDKVEDLREGGEGLELYHMGSTGVRLL